MKNLTLYSSPLRPIPLPLSLFLLLPRHILFPSVANFRPTLTKFSFIQVFLLSLLRFPGQRRAVLKHLRIFPRRVATDEKGDNEIDKCRVQASPLSRDIAKYRGSMRCRQIFHAESCCGEREYLCFLQRSSPING